MIYGVSAIAVGGGGGAVAAGGSGGGAGVTALKYGDEGVVVRCGGEE